MRLPRLALALTASAACAAGALSVTAPATPATAATKPLTGKVVVIDPGHQLGNSRHLAQINRKVNAGGFYKPCNSTGTQTNSGYHESTFTFSVASYLKERLELAGARVYLTRYSESTALWGPCIDVRGRLGNGVHANAVISIHGDGAASSDRGFFVIRPAYRRGWTDDIYSRSQTLSYDVRAGLRAAGLPYANYYGGDGFDTRGDLGTLNWSNVPIVMVELGNMRNSRDAAQMRSAWWRDNRYAAGLAKGVTAFLSRR